MTNEEIDKMVYAIIKEVDYNVWKELYSPITPLNPQLNLRSSCEEIYRCQIEEKEETICRLRNIVRKCLV